MHKSMKKNSLALVLPVMFGFLAMGWIRDVSGSQIAAIIAIVVVWLYMLWLNRRIQRI